MEIKTTAEYYRLSHDELLEDLDVQGLDTKEEYLLSEEGKAVIYYDDVEDMEEWKHEREKDEIKVVLKTINERIAVIIR